MFCAKVIPTSSISGYAQTPGKLKLAAESLGISFTFARIEPHVGAMSVEAR